MSTSLSIYRGQPGFESIRAEWEGFAQRHGTHFLHFPAWYGAELEQSGGEQVYFVAIRDGNELTAVLPLQHCRLQVRGLPLPIVQIYYPNEMGVNDVLSRIPLRAGMREIYAALKQEMPFFLFMRWQCVLEDGCAISAAQPGQDVRYTHESKHLDFPDGYDAFVGGLGSKVRTDVAKKLRKLAQCGEPRLEVVSQPSRLAQAFAVFLALEDSGWKGRSGTSISRQPAKLAYYRYLLEHYGRLGLCRINLLYCDGVAVAGQFGIEVGSCLYLLKIGFREDFGQLSPGALLLDQAICRCAAGPAVRRVSFVTGSPWCDRWHPACCRVGVFYTNSGTPLGRVAVRALEWRLRVRDRRDQHRRATASESTPC